MYMYMKIILWWYALEAGLALHLSLTILTMSCGNTWIIKQIYCSCNIYVKLKPLLAWLFSSVLALCLELAACWFECDIVALRLTLNYSWLLLLNRLWIMTKTAFDIYIYKIDFVNCISSARSIIRIQIILIHTVSLILSISERNIQVRFFLFAAISFPLFAILPRFSGWRYDFSLLDNEPQTFMMVVKMNEHDDISPF